MSTAATQHSNKPMLTWLGIADNMCLIQLVWSCKASQCMIHDTLPSTSLQACKHINFDAFGDLVTLSAYNAP